MKKTTFITTLFTSALIMLSCEDQCADERAELNRLNQKLEHWKERERFFSGQCDIYFEKISDGNQDDDLLEIFDKYQDSLDIAGLNTFFIEISIDDLKEKTPCF